MTTWTARRPHPIRRCAGGAGRRSPRRWLASHTGDRVGGAGRRRPVHPLGQRTRRRVVPRHQGDTSRPARRRLDAVDVDFVDAVGDADDEIDAAYQRKYGRYPGPVASITSPVARATTLKLVPHQPD